MQSNPRTEPRRGSFLIGWAFAAGVVVSHAAAAAHAVHNAPAEARAAHLSKIDEIASLRFHSLASPDIVLTDVVFGIHQGRLIFARRSSSCSHGSGVEDHLRDVGAIVFDTDALPEPIPMRVYGEEYLVHGFTFLRREDHVPAIGSLRAVRESDGTAIEWRKTSDTSDLQAPCVLVLAGVCGQGNCGMLCRIDVADCDPCDCDGTVIEYCTDDATFACFQPTACPTATQTCQFSPAACECICAPPPPGAPLCSGDGSLATACPCAPPDVVPSPPSAPGHGCANSLNLAGSRLAAFGTTAPDTVKLEAHIAAAYTGFAFLVKGDGVNSNGLASGDGVRCVDGALVRFGGHNAGTNGDSIGKWTYPNAVQTISISAATAQPPSQVAFYQLIYRNAAPGFCNAATVNWSNGWRIPW